jgi:hypothetical protein
MYVSDTAKELPPLSPIHPPKTKRVCIYYLWSFSLLSGVVVHCSSYSESGEIQGRNLSTHWLAHVFSHTHKKAALPPSCPKVKAQGQQEEFPTKATL